MPRKPAQALAEEEERASKPRRITAEEYTSRVLLEAGLSFVTAYPGPPTQGIVEHLVRLGWASEATVLWAPSPRSAFEQAHGAALAGRKSAVCLNGQGFLEAAPSLIAAARVGCNAPLLIVLGDDPGGWDSFAEVDSRSLLATAGIPTFEPAQLQDLAAMVPEALQLSRAYDLPVALRLTAAFLEEEEKGAGSGDFLAGAPVSNTPGNAASGVTERLAVPVAATLRHQRQLARIEHLRHASRFTRFVDVVGAGNKGIIAVGHAYSKLVDVVGSGPHDKLKIMRLGQTFPLPDYHLLEFSLSLEEVLVLEEGEPLVETELRSLLAEHVSKPRVHGKLSGSVSREGELQRWQIEEAVGRLVPGLRLEKAFFPLSEKRQRPSLSSICLGCPLVDVHQAVAKLTTEKDSGKSPLVVGDHGCLVYLASRREGKAVGVLAAPGSSIRVAMGYARARDDRPVLALTGDYSLLDRGLSDLFSPDAQQLPLTVLVVDNAASAYTGGPERPGRPGVALEDLLGALQPPVLRVLHEPTASQLTRVLEECLGARKLSVVVVKFTCMLVEGEVEEDEDLQ